MNEAAPPPSPKGDKRRRGRNLAVFLALLAVVALIYATTIVKIKLVHQL